MPSLQQLEEFKYSFKDLGNEALIMANSQIPPEDFELPHDEAPAPFPEGLESGPDLGADLGMPDLADLGLDVPSESFSIPEVPGDTDAGEPGFPAGADFDFGDLLGGASAESILSPAPDLPGIPDIPDVSGIPDLSDAAVPEAFSSGETAEGSSGVVDVPQTAETFPVDGLEDLPDDLLGAFAGDLESGGLPADEGMAEPPLPAEGAEPPGTAELSGNVPAADFSDIEFPDIDLSQAMDMGGEIRDAAVESGSAGAEPETAEPETAEPAPEGEIPETENFDLGDLGDSGVLEPVVDQPAEADDFTAGEAGFDTADLGDTDLGATDFGAADFGAADFGADLDISGFGEAGDVPGSLDLGGETADDTAVPEPDDVETVPEELAPADNSFSDLAIPDFGESPDDFPDVDAGFPGAETGTPVPAGTSGAADDPFESFDLGEGSWTPPSEPLESPDFSAPVDDFGDFSLAGIDDATTPGARPSRTAAGPASEDVEEIRLSEEEYKRLQDTLSAYPLNLRIACEELIAEQAVAPDLMSALIKLLARGAPAKETAALAGRILGRTIPIPRGYAKQTGAELEEEQASFGYIFVHSFLPVLRLFGAIALVVLCLGYLTLRFVIIPLQAENLYKQGYTALESGEYARANELFLQGFKKHRVKNWFYRYAEGFRDERQYIYAERKYDELLRAYPRDKKGALDYAAMETYYRYNYEKADLIIRTNILDYAVNDREGLMALAENNLAWAETEPSRYEEARAAYARLMEKYGRQDPFLEGMLKYFIRTDQLDEVLPLQAHFMSNPKKRKISVPALAELGGYLIDKKFAEEEGVPDEYVDKIEGIRDILLRAVKADENYPESYYHLARYYNRYGSTAEERQTLEKAVRIFDNAREETSRRAGYRVDAHRRYAEVLINAQEFFSAEEELVRGVRLYEDARARQVLKTRSEFGRLYADLGDLEFFVKDGDMAAALRFYQEAERNGWSPPEIQYRMGVAHYQNGEWEDALRLFFALTSSMPNNKRLLYALGNAAYMRGNYFAAQGYYNRLMDLLTAERVRFPNMAPGGRPEEQDLAERIMVADNNLGVTLETLTRISGDTGYRTRALGLFSESIRAWDILTRNPESMARMRPIKDLYGPGVNLAYLNAQNILHPEPDYELQLFMRIDRDALEPSPWENLVPRDYQLSDQLLPMQVE
jgi:tetratricopeptide (TPR) repeat protein